VIPAPPERLVTETLGMLCRHALHERHQRRPGGRREGETTRKEKAEERVRLAQVVGAEPDEVRPQFGQLVGLRWCQRESVGREDPADRVHVKPIHDALSRGRQLVRQTRRGRRPVGAPLPAAPFQCAPEGGGCQPVALGKALGVGLRVLGYAAVSAETWNPLMAVVPRTRKAV
jgi:hypothetical protein